MGRIYIDFAATGQDLEKTSPGIVAEGSNCLYARFALSPEWDGLRVYARFKRMAEVYDVPLEGGEARVPLEVDAPTGFEVSIWGESGAELLTTRALFVPVERTIDLKGLDPLQPTDSLAEQFFQGLETAEANAAQAKADAAEAKADAQNATPPTGTREGASVHAENAIAVPLARFSVFGVCLQDGTPTHEARAPIAAVTRAALRISGEDMAAYDEYALNLGGYELAALPCGIRDELRIEGGRLVLCKNVAKAVFDGSADEDWQYVIAGGFGYFAAVLPEKHGMAYKPDNSVFAVSDFTAVSKGGNNREDGFWFGTATGYAALTNSVYDGDVAALKAALANEPATLYYLLAEPREIDLGAFEAPTVPAPVFNAWAACNVAADVRGEWFTEAGRQVSVAQEWAARAALTGGGGGSVTAPAIIDNGDGTFTLRY